ncbi:hypothetical protein BKA70DRAFT_1333795 [Coprinopsis sp. MPI-PUGE-AT-0042]|nr:hypothetical protein BKA70DRAFT_1333795 [Coprinopsis sp. MPI-PUGE-AT-0042]
MSNSLDLLKKTGTVVVSDSGDFECTCRDLISHHKDATTNPSLILAAANKPNTRASSMLPSFPDASRLRVDARLSFDKEGTKAKAKELIALYESVGIKKERILIKIASTWEGIQAARELERDDGIHCNLTLLFGFGQAVACAEAGVTLISPFVGRILDWYKKKTGKNYEGDEEPRCPVRQAHLQLLQAARYKTIVMGASFRPCGVDFLTISPSLLDELKNSSDQVPQKLDSKSAGEEPIAKVTYIDNEPEFRWSLLEDSMAFDKLHEGIKKFAEDGETLKDLLRKKLSA